MTMNLKFTSFIFLVMIKGLGLTLLQTYYSQEQQKQSTLIAHGFFHLHHLYLVLPPYFKKLRQYSFSNSYAALSRLLIFLLRRTGIAHPRKLPHTPLS